MNASLRRFLLAFVGFVAWIAAGHLLSCRLHLVYMYDVIQEPRFPDWRFAVLVGIGGLLSLGAWRAAGPGNSTHGAGGAGAAIWLAACGGIPVLEELRQLGFPIPRGFIEPLFFAFASGMAAWLVVRRVPWTPRERRFSEEVPWFGLVLVAAAGCGAWWYDQGDVAYSNYVLGYHDFADFARRIVNTWEGRGFLVRSPLWPPFFDHANPGLLLLVPLWGLWPDARLFMLAQAACLALPALFVYAIARRLGAARIGAAAWAGAYLTYPAVAQLNLGYSYGFHAVSVALPLLVAALGSCFAGRRWLALGLAIVACMFKEDVFVAVSGFALAMAVLEALRRPALRRSAPPTGRDPLESPLSGLTPRQWLVVWGGFGLAFVLTIYFFGLMGPAATWRFTNLGGTFSEILLSPLLRPGIFWSEVFSRNSAYYLLCLFVPAGLPFVFRGWPVLIALVAPLAVLLAWGFDGATCIAFQYVTLLIPVVFLAAMIGAAPRCWRATGGNRGLAHAGLLALTSSTVASLFIGALPFSQTTIPFTFSAEEAAEWTPHRIVLDQAVKIAGGPEAATLASGRLASHFLGVKRLEMVRHALQEVDALGREAGPGKRWIEVFDWVVVDVNDRALHHSLAELGTCVLAAESAGYRPVLANDGVLVYRRPGMGPGPIFDPLAAWRVSSDKLRELTGGGDGRLIAPGIRVARTETRLIRSDDFGPSRIEVEIVLQAAETRPPEYLFRCVVRRQDGGIVAGSNRWAPVGGNRPTTWWSQGEAWIERSALLLPPGLEREKLFPECQAIPYEHPFD